MIYLWISLIWFSSSNHRLNDSNGCSGGRGRLLQHKDKKIKFCHKLHNLTLFQPVRALFIFGTQIKIFLMKSESFLTLHWQATQLKCFSWTCIEDWHIFVSFVHKMYSRSFIKLRLNHWGHMEYFIYVLNTFLGLESFSHHFLWLHGKEQPRSSYMNIIH